MVQSLGWAFVRGSLRCNNGNWMEVPIREASARLHCTQSLLTSTPAITAVTANFIGQLQYCASSIVGKHIHLPTLLLDIIPQLLSKSA